MAMFYRRLLLAPLLAGLFAGALVAASCTPRSAPRHVDSPDVSPPSAPSQERTVSPEPSPSDPWAAARAEMVRVQIANRGIRDRRVLTAMATVPRHRFVPPGDRDRAYADHPLPIGHRQTISQPYIVAWMTELVSPEPGDRVLDVGTGSGYQAAVLAEIVEQVYSVEIVCDLANDARARLADLGYANVEVRCGDGWAGWLAHAPFDAIVLAAAPEEVPPALIRQLAPGGKLVLPVGPERGTQWMKLLEKDANGKVIERTLDPVRFVPMTGEAQE